MKLLAIAFLVAATVAVVGGLSFHLPVDTSKCLQEDVHKDVLVVGEYEIEEEYHDDEIITLEITDSRGHPVYRKEDASMGKFAFTSDDYDVFEICFNSELHGDDADEDTKRKVTLNMKVGSDAKNYDELAKAEKLKPMELELTKLEDMTQAIVKDFQRMKQLEEEHRDTNENTNERMLHFSIFSIVCLVGLAIWQVLYLKRYFKSKKLI